MQWENALMMSPDALMASLLNMGTGALIWMIVFAIIVSLPSLLVLMSNRSKGVAKLAWFVLTSLFSWLAYAIFLIVTKPPSNDGAPRDVVTGKVD